MSPLRSLGDPQRVGESPQEGGDDADGGFMSRKQVDLAALLVVLKYAQMVTDEAAVRLEDELPDEARDLLVEMELAASLN